MIYKIVFWASIILICYTYFIYPVVITILSLFIRKKVYKRDIEPAVSLLITAYNEEKNIGKKIENSLGINYPSDKFEIIVASDGSDDETDNIVRSYQNNDRNIHVRLHRVEGRVGKTATQNSAIKICKGDIIIFSDAASIYDKESIGAIVRNYADENVGAVSGMYEYVNTEKVSAGKGTSLFWDIENYIKKRQTKIRTITGCCGCIYSVRRDLYEDLPAEIISDLVEPLKIVEKGYRIVFEPMAIAYEDIAGKTRDEFKMRIRVIVRGIKGMLYMKKLYNLKKYPFIAFQLISHKVIRWLVPFFCIFIFITSIMLSKHSSLYAFLLYSQIIFYIFAIIGYMNEKKKKSSKIFYIPLYFCIVNLASLISIFKVIKGENIITWETKR